MSGWLRLITMNISGGNLPAMSSSGQGGEVTDPDKMISVKVVADI